MLERCSQMLETFVFFRIKGRYLYCYRSLREVMTMTVDNEANFIVKKAKYSKVKLRTRFAY